MPSALCIIIYAQCIMFWEPHLEKKASQEPWLSTCCLGWKPQSRLGLETINILSPERGQKLWEEAEWRSSWVTSGQVASSGESQLTWVRDQVPLTCCPIRCLPLCVSVSFTIKWVWDWCDPSRVVVRIHASSCQIPIPFASSWVGKRVILQSHWPEQ